MPNWCNNTIELTHKDSAMIQRAYDAFNEGRLLAEFCPVPEDLHIVAGCVGDPDEQKKLVEQTEANRAKHGYGNWYDYCVNEWGTKWDVGGDGSIRREGANTLHASFESAWAPPCAAYEKLAALGFEIKAYYNECGMAFAGIWSGNEDEFNDDYYEYGGMSSDQLAEELPSDLDEMFGISESAAEWEAENAEDEENLDIDLDGGVSAVNEQGDTK
jgi:hypothetical protein